MKKIVACLFLASLVSACAARLSTESISQFGAATEKTVEILSDGIILEDELAVRSKILRNACNYIASPTSNNHLAAARVTERPKLLVEQISYLNALKGYAKALSSATDAQSIANLEKAAEKFGASAAALFATATGPAAAGAGALIGTGVKAVVVFTEFDRQRRIRAIAESVDKSLSDGLNLIANDSLRIEIDLRKRLAEWDREANCVLRHAASSRGEAVNLFIELDRQKRAYQTRIAALRSGVDAMAMVVIAHDKIVNGENVRQAIADLVIFIDQVQAIKTAVDGLT